MAATYSVGGMAHGAQQQQMINAQLRSFGHINSMGGRGFTGVESHVIGDTMRNMASQRGPGAEFATMDELGRLAANMGRMGIGQSVRSAKDFTDKFKEMMTAVKSIATSFSTSLEEAQKVMQSMRGSGIFGMTNQSVMANFTRQMAVGGKVGLQEVAAASNIGSQLARSIGGRGKHGAIAGARAMGNLGAALSSGVLTEEQVYNATGLSGEEGRQAYVSQQLQADASFFRGSRGRQILAASMREGGHVDANILKRMMRGELGVQDTIAARGSHVYKVGQADFTWNEGRARGEAMAMTAGMGGAMALTGWMRDKGFDPMTMDSKALIGYQRQLRASGIDADRDQIEGWLRQARHSDRIMDTQSDNAAGDDLVRKLEIYNKNVGMEGVKRNIEDAKRGIDHALEQAGANILQSFSSTIEEAFNSFTGEYARKISTDMSRKARLAARGSTTPDTMRLTGGLAASVADMEQMFGAKRAVARAGEPAHGDFEVLSESGRYDALGENVSAYNRRGTNLTSITGGLRVLTDRDLTPRDRREYDDSGGVWSIHTAYAPIREDEFRRIDADKEMLDIGERIYSAGTTEERASARTAALAAYERAKEALVKAKESDGDVDSAEQRVNSLAGFAAMSELAAGTDSNQVLKTYGRNAKDLQGFEAGTRTLVGSRQLRERDAIVKQYVQNIRSEGETTDEAAAGLADWETQRGGSIDVLNARVNVAAYVRKGRVQDKELLDAQAAADKLVNSGASREEIQAAQDRLLAATEKHSTQQRERQNYLAGLPAAQLAMYEEAAPTDATIAYTSNTRSTVESMQRSRVKGASAMGLASRLGGEISSDAAKSISDEQDVDKATNMFLAELGLSAEDAGDNRGLISEFLGAQRKGDSTAATRALMKLEGSGIDEKIIERGKTKQDEDAKQNDPSYRLLESSNKHLEIIARAQPGFADAVAKIAAERGEPRGPWYPPAPGGS
jgi:hypothetical protein